METKGGRYRFGCDLMTAVGYDPNGNPKFEERLFLYRKHGIWDASGMYDPMTLEEVEKIRAKYPNYNYHLWPES